MPFAERSFSSHPVSMLIASLIAVKSQRLWTWPSLTLMASCTICQHLHPKPTFKYLLNGLVSPSSSTMVLTMFCSANMAVCSPALLSQVSIPLLMLISRAFLKKKVWIAKVKCNSVLGLTALRNLFAEARDELIRKISLIKRNILAAPFERAFKEQEQFEDDKQPNPNPELMAVHYREDEAIYVKASQDRVTVIFSTRFKDETDRVFGKVFLQVWAKLKRLECGSFAHSFLLRNSWTHGSVKISRMLLLFFSALVNRLWNFDILIWKTVRRWAISPLVSSLTTKRQRSPVWS